jgi:alpha-maltose-1-phosphate synthase
MRIVLLSYAFYDFTIQLANSLANENDVLLILPDITPQMNLGVLKKNVKLHLIKKFISYDPRNLPTYYQTMSLIRAYKPDIVHFQFNFRWLFFLPILKKYPKVVTIHDVIPHLGTSFLLDRFMRLNVLLMGKFFNQMIVHGKIMKEQLIREYSVKEKKVNVLPLCEHNVELIKKSPRSLILEKRNAVLFFGNISKYKGVEYLIKAEPIIIKEIPEIIIIIAGKGDYFNEIKHLILNKNSFDIRNHYISDKEAADLFQSCSLVVLPYIDASQSGVIPLAYAFRKPIIVTNVGSLPEVVEDGTTGFIVPPKDPSALAEKIVMLLKNEDLRRNMGENAYKKLKTDLSFDKLSVQIIAIYSKCLNC